MKPGAEYFLKALDALAERSDPEADCYHERRQRADTVNLTTLPRFSNTRVGKAGR